MSFFWGRAVGGGGWRLAAGGGAHTRTHETSRPPFNTPHTHANNSTDDTAAFQDALTKLDGPGVLRVPAGKYVITAPIQKWRGQLIIAGDGIDRTTLYLPKTLTEIYGNNYTEGG